MSLGWFMAGVAVGIIISAICSGAADKWLDKKKNR